MYHYHSPRTEINHSIRVWKGLRRCYVVVLTMKFPSGNVYKNFYSGLDEYNRQMVDASYGGNFTCKTDNAA